jgi:hypothetical protein
MDSQENQIGHSNPDQPKPKRIANIQQGTQNDEVGYRHAHVPPDFDIGHF